MTLLQDLRGRELTGCRGCDAIRKGLYKGLDLWKPDRRLQLASTHDSFNASPLGAFSESPLKARGGGEAANICEATATDIIESSASSVAIQRWGGSNVTLNAGYFAVTFELLAFGPNDDDEFSDTTYAHLASGASSGNAHDFTGTSFDQLGGGTRPRYRTNTTTGVYDRMWNQVNTGDTNFREIRWEIRYQAGASGIPSPFWQDGETVNIPCIPGSHTVFEDVDAFSPFLIDPSLHDVNVCGEGDIRLDDFAWWHQSTLPNSRAPMITAGVGLGSFWCTDQFEASVNAWIPLDNVVVEDPSADFSNLTSHCFRRQAFTQAGQGDNEFFRIKRVDAVDASGRADYLCTSVSTIIRSVTDGDAHLQMIPA